MLTELVELPAGSFRMGSTSFYPEEAPIHTVNVASFAIERHPVTNAQFAEFVDDTGYVTVAERELDPQLFPGADPADLVPGGLVFLPAAGPVNLRDWRQWWEWRPGACWRHPFGPDSGINDRLEHPVVQVAYPDAAAYARWARRRLPSEAEWEYAARARTTTARWWGEDLGKGHANCNGCGSPVDYRYLADVDSFAPNPFGLFGMLGNAWQWTADCWHDSYVGAPSDGSAWTSGDCSRHVIRGGSWDNLPVFVRSAARSGSKGDGREYDYSSLAGFRVARDLP
jgi:formylglycine-generating enzyme